MHIDIFIFFSVLPFVTLIYCLFRIIPDIIAIKKGDKYNGNAIKTYRGRYVISWVDKNDNLNEKVLFIVAYSQRQSFVNVYQYKKIVSFGLYSVIGYLVCAIASLLGLVFFYYVFML